MTHSDTKPKVAQGPWTIRLDDASPSQNLLDRCHWAERRQIKQEWMWRLQANKTARTMPKASCPRSLRVERHGRGVLDTANLCGGLKGIIDNMVELGLFLDDNPKNLVFQLPTQHKLTKGQHPHTILIVEDVAEAEAVA